MIADSKMYMTVDSNPNKLLSESNKRGPKVFTKVDKNGWFE